MKLLVASRRTLGSILVLLALTSLAATLAYQCPLDDTIAIGWFGDRLFLDSSSGLRREAVERGDWYSDDLTGDSPTGRSRWTRQYARMVLPAVGAGRTLVLTLLIQGWPEDCLVSHPRQPLLTVRANGHPVGEWFPTPAWEATTVVVPAAVQTRAELTLELATSTTFTDTLRGSDPRPKGVRVALVRAVEYDPSRASGYHFGPVYLPPLRTVLLLMVHAILCYGIGARLFHSPWFVFGCASVVIGGESLALALARIWMGGILPLISWILIGGMLITWGSRLVRWWWALSVRYTMGNSLNYGLIVAALSSLAYGVASLFPPFTSPVLVGLAMGGVLVLPLVPPWGGHFSRTTVFLVELFERYALRITGLVGGMWLSYQAMVVAHLPYVGHADYADNAVVARNILAGRGWVVDYVTQFYRLYDGITRPQETWPLLQPVWIAISFWLLGVSAWAAKVPNFLFSAVLLLLIFAAGAYAWNRRTGALAALLTLTNHLFFTLNVYTTSDLAFVVFTTAAIFALFVWEEQNERHPTIERTSWFSRRWLMGMGAGVLTGLMMLQKPSGAVIAVGLGIWLLIRTGKRRGIRGIFVPFLTWAIPALVILSPYLIRNHMLFGTPVYSTEQHDAWVLGYRGASAEAWNDIYRVYVPELGGMGVPDRSWILRWGFDHVGEKLMTQVRATRDYLIPAWWGREGPHLGDAQRRLLMGSGQKNIFSPTGTWLACLGLLIAVRRRARLVNLLLLAFAPYTLFLITYWHADEERYFLVVIPWQAMLAAKVLWEFFDRVALTTDSGRSDRMQSNGPWGHGAMIVVGILVVQTAQFSWPKIAEKIHDEPARWAPDIAAYTWLREHTPPNAVIMTRNPWQLNWHSERPAVMIPNTSEYEILMAIANHYQACYLIFETMQRVKGDASRLLSKFTAIEQVSVGDTIEGFTLVYGSPTPDNRVLIYRFPETMILEGDQHGCRE